MIGINLIHNPGLFSIKTNGVPRKPNGMKLNVSKTKKIVTNGPFSNKVKQPLKHLCARLVTSDHVTKFSTVLKTEDNKN